MLNEDYKLSFVLDSSIDPSLSFSFETHLSLIRSEWGDSSRVASSSHGKNQKKPTYPLPTYVTELTPTTDTRTEG